MPRSRFYAQVRRCMKGGGEEAYKIKAGQYTYYVRISTDGYDYSLNLGGCVQIRIPIARSALAGSNCTKTAFIKYVRYDPKCSANSDRDLVSGYGTRHMLKTALSIVKSVYPSSDIRAFRFNDTSRKTCPDGAVVNLPYFMVALYGQTYYEKYFHARIEDDVVHDKYRSSMNAKLALRPSETIPFEQFVEAFQVPGPDVQQAIQDAYMSAPSYAGFFTAIREQHPERVCQLLQGWVDRFVVTWLFDGRDFTGLHWIIPADRVPDIDVKEWEDVTATPLDISIANREQYAGSGSVHDFGPDPVF